MNSTGPKERPFSSSIHPPVPPFLPFTFPSLFASSLSIFFYTTHTRSRLPFFRAETSRDARHTYRVISAAIYRPLPRGRNPDENRGFSAFTHSSLLSSRLVSSRLVSSPFVSYVRGVYREPLIFPTLDNWVSARRWERATTDSLQVVCPNTPVRVLGETDAYDCSARA